MSETNSNNVVTNLINNITSEYDFNSYDASDIIVIDSSDCRIGVKTYNPEYEIHVSGGTIKTTYLDLSNGFVRSDLIPDTEKIPGPTPSDLSGLSNRYNLGSQDKPWNSIYCVNAIFQDMYISPDTLNMGNKRVLSLDSSDNIKFGNESQNFTFERTNDISINGNLSVSQNVDVSNTTSFNIYNVKNIDSSSGEVNNLDISKGTINCISLNNRLIQNKKEFINRIRENTLGIDISVNITNNSTTNFKLGFWEVLANRQHINKLKTIASKVESAVVNISLSFPAIVLVFIQAEIEKLELKGIVVLLIPVFIKLLLPLNSAALLNLPLELYVTLEAVPL